METQNIIAVIDGSKLRALSKCEDLTALLNQLRTSAIKRTGLPFSSIKFLIEKHSNFHYAFLKLVPESSYNFELVDHVCLHKYHFYLVIDSTEELRNVKRSKDKKVCFYNTEWATF